VKRFGSGQQVAAFVAVALTMVGAASCGNSAVSTKERAITTARKSTPQARAAESNYSLSTLLASSSQSAGYYTARYAWIVSNTGAGDVGAAGQGAYLIVAITDLKLGLAHDYRLPGGKQAYRAAIRELRQMASLPDTDVTPKQRAEYDADLARLNRFFGTKIAG